MSLEKIELLVEKIDVAIKTIQQLKEENKKYSTRLIKFQNEIKRLTAENQKLKSENLVFSNEKNKTVVLHKKLEDKIEEILKYLPDEVEKEEKNNNIEKKINNNVEEKKVENKAEEKEEEAIKKIFDEPEVIENKNLFSNKEDDSDDVTHLKTKVDPIQNNKKKEVKKQNNKNVDIKFEETLLDDNEVADINFHIDSEDTMNDLPKGVL